MEKNSNVVIALIAAVILIISLPVVFFLVKEKDRSHLNFRQPTPQVAPQPAPQPPVVVVPPAPQPQPPAVIVVPTPVIPHDCVRDMYTKGWEDAHFNRPPNPALKGNPDYVRGYRDYFSKHRPGIKLEFNFR